MENIYIFLLIAEFSKDILYNMTYIIQFSSSSVTICLINIARKLNKLFLQEEINPKHLVLTVKPATVPWQLIQLLLSKKSIDKPLLHLFHYIHTICANYTTAYNVCLKCNTSHIAWILSISIGYRRIGLLPNFMFNIP